jgi:hypothetical protein
MYMELNEEQKRAVRAAARERKRKQRDRDKQKRIRALEAQHAAAERAERSRRNLHCYGESTPGRNAVSCADESQIHREFLRALNQPDVQPADTLRSLAKRTFELWVAGPLSSRDGGKIYVPGFNRAAQQFDGEFGFVIGDVPFEKVWTPPKDCSGDEPIDVESLPKLPNLPTTPLGEEPAPEPTTPPPPPVVVVSTEQPNTISYTWVHPSASRYLNSR